jgi:hypothetical protein
MDEKKRRMILSRICKASGQFLPVPKGNTPFKEEYEGIVHKRFCSTAY